MSGWWFLSSGGDYTHPPELFDFLKHRPVYIGFGSMKGNPEFCKMLSTSAIKSLQLAGVRGVLLGGWAGLTRASLDASTDEGKCLYAWADEGKCLYAWAEENVFEIDSCPHDWLFPQCAAVVHHGGAGTLAAGIRAGCPAIVCATQGDQPFHGSLVQTRGIGRYLGMVGSAKLTAESVAAGIEDVMTGQSIIAAAQAIGAEVQSEDGVHNAISFIGKMATSFPYSWPVKKEYNKPQPTPLALKLMNG